MTTQHTLEISAPEGDDELRAFRAIGDYAFNENPSPAPDIARLQRQGIENLRVARVGGVVAAGLGMLPMGQWFGGTSVPMVGINAVSTAPEHRSTGIMSRMLRQMLEEIHADGSPLSALYPTTQPVYRRAGYEQAGIALDYKHPLHALSTGDRGLQVRRAGDEDTNTIQALYAERARRTTGNLDRSEFMWARVLEPREAPLNKYLVERDGTSEGYVIYTQRQPPGTKEKDINCYDLVALTADAARRLVAFFADHRSTAEHLVWTGAPAEPLLLHVPNQAYKIDWYEQWMLRIVDVPAALAARGYPTGVEAELHLEVRDDVLAPNNGRWVLAVSDGRAEVREGGTGSIALDVRGLAPMYTGYLSPLELRAGGYVQGPEADLALAGTVFAGPTPWMADGF
ncbi:MAG: GNAT family N-acetyltransferase [Chloroflexia bacterium]|nr:GNAT family N-acetyltransferase [Chloroflexia bacterium]